MKSRPCGCENVLAHWIPPTRSLMLSEADPSDYQKSSVIAEEYSLFPSASPDYSFLGLRAGRVGSQSGTETEEDDEAAGGRRRTSRRNIHGSRGGR